MVMSLTRPSVRSLRRRRQCGIGIALLVKQGVEPGAGKRHAGFVGAPVKANNSILTLFAM